MILRIFWFRWLLVSRYIDIFVILNHSGTLQKLIWTFSRTLLICKFIDDNVHFTNLLKACSQRKLVAIYIVCAQNSEICQHNFVKYELSYVIDPHSERSVTSLCVATFTTLYGEFIQ